jgi:hypothetical protein
MSRLKIFILVLVTLNILLIGLEVSKPSSIKVPSEQSVGAHNSDVPSIRLLSELDGFSKESLNKQCFAVGPFESEETVNAIVELLQGYTTKVASRQTNAFVDRGFWVYLPAFEEELLAREAVNVLYIAGLDDVALILGGEFNNSVSLGYFINQSNATTHRDRIRELGFPAEFRIRREDESRFWVDYGQETGFEYASRVLADFVPPELHMPTSCTVTDTSSIDDPAHS